METPHHGESSGAESLVTATYGPPAHWYVVVAGFAFRNFERALAEGVWGAREARQFEDATGTFGPIQRGDQIHFLTGARWPAGAGGSPPGYPRVASEAYAAATTEYRAEVTRSLYEDPTPIWDDDGYPFRFGFRVVAGPSPVDYRPGVVPDAVREAVRLSHTQRGRACPAPESFGLRDALTYVLTEYRDARRAAFARHPLASFLRQDLPNALVQSGLVTRTRFRVQGSAGQGTWARVPWVVIQDQGQPRTVQDGLYVAYGFDADSGRVSLGLGFGVAGPSQRVGRSRARQTIEARIDDLRPRLTWPDGWIINLPLELSRSGRGADYGWATAGYKVYERVEMPDEAALRRDLDQVLALYREALSLVDDPAPEIVEGGGDLHAHEDTDSWSLLQFDPEQASAALMAAGYRISTPNLLNVLLSLHVRPFVILSGRSGTGKTTLTSHIANLFDWTHHLVAVSPAWADPADLLGFISPVTHGRVPGALEPVLKRGARPTLLCLDEFNVAKVEHYFSDFVSAMDQGTVRDFWGQLEALNHLADPTLALPKPFRVIATMNFDDSVQSLTPRILDRANVIEFDVGSAEALIVDEGRDAEALAARFRWPWSDDYPDIPEDVVADVRALWDATKTSRGQFGHRVAQEMARYVAWGLQYGEWFGGTLGEQRAGLLDRQVVQRLLPKFHGTASARDVAALGQLLIHLTGSNQDAPTTAEARQHVLEQSQNTGRFPLSVAKVGALFASYTEDGYASFW